MICLFHKRALCPCTHIYWVIYFRYITVLFRFCFRQYPPSGMSIAVTTTPMVLLTASPTFLARVPPSSSSSSASSTSTQRQKKKPYWCHAHTNVKWQQAEEQQRTCDVIEKVCTCIRSSLLKADVTDSDGGETPASLRDRHSSGGAAITESLPTGTAVVLSVVILEDCMTLMAHLIWEKKTITTDVVIDQALKPRGRKFYLVTCKDTVGCVIGTDSKHPPQDMKVLTWLLAAGGRRWGCVWRSPRWGSWVSSRLVRSDLSAKRWRPWQVWHWSLTQTGPLGWLHPEAAVQHCCYPSKSHPTAEKHTGFNEI